MPVYFYQAIHSTAFFDKVEKGNIFQWITLQRDFCFKGYILTVMLPQENFRKFLEFNKLEEKTVQLFWLFRKNSKQYEGIYQDWYTFGLLAEWKTHLMDIPSQVTWIRDQWGMKLSNRQIKNQNTPSKLTFFSNTRKQISNSWFFLRRNNSIIDQDRSVKMARYQPWFLFSVFMYLNLAFLIYEMKTGDLKDLQSSSVFDNSNIECDGKL